MPGKKFQTQLENLFTTDKLTEQDPSSVDVSASSGWMWECDQQGNITYCSPEVELALGIPANDFISQNLLSYRLSFSSCQGLTNLFKDAEQSKEILVFYKHLSGVSIPVMFYTLGNWKNDDGDEIVRGFCQLLQSGEKEGSLVSIPEILNQEKGGELKAKVEPISLPNQDSGEKQKKIKITSQLIHEMLKHLKNTNPLIHNANASEIHIFTQENSIQPDTTEEDNVQYLFGKKIVTRPSLAITHLVHRLEWGIKLDLTEKEKEFLSNHRYRTNNVFARLRNPFIHKEILKTEKSWFDVVVQIEPGKTPWIEIQSTIPEGVKPEISVNAFLSDPPMLMPQLRQAMQHPYQTKEVLLHGKDFFIPL
jgi:hypothetical protein